MNFNQTVEAFYHVPVRLTPLPIHDFTRVVHPDGSIHLPYSVDTVESGHTYRTDDDGNPEFARVRVDLYDWQLAHKAGSGNVLANLIKIMRKQMDAEVAAISWQVKAKRSTWRDTFNLEIVPVATVCSAPKVHFAAGDSHWSWQGLFSNNPEQSAIVAAALAPE